MKKTHNKENIIECLKAVTAILKPFIDPPATPNTLMWNGTEYTSSLTEFKQDAYALACWSTIYTIIGLLEAQEFPILKIMVGLGVFYISPFFKNSALNLFSHCRAVRADVR